MSFINEISKDIKLFFFLQEINYLFPSVPLIHSSTELTLIFFKLCNNAIFNLSQKFFTRFALCNVVKFAIL